MSLKLLVPKKTAITKLLHIETQEIFVSSVINGPITFSPTKMSSF